MTSERKQELQNTIISGFFGFWIKKYRISFIIALAIVVIGIFAMITIPKESMPSINFGIVTVATSYPGASSEDIDTTVTQKIYKKIQDINGIDTVNAQSSLGMSLLAIQLKTSVNINDVVNEIRNAVDSVQLPENAKKPNITSVEMDTKRLFSFFIYNKEQTSSRFELTQKAIAIKKELENLPAIDSVHFELANSEGGITTNANDDSAYEVILEIPDTSLQSFGITLSDVAQAIRGINFDQPIGNFVLDNKTYTYRISGKNQTSFDFLATPIMLPKGGAIQLADIATLKRKYKNEKEYTIIPNTSFENPSYNMYHSVVLTVNKKNTASIFTAHKEASEKLEEIFAKNDFSKFQYLYTHDVAAMIIDDYKILAKEAITTLVLVFFIMFLFVGFFDSLFATLVLPLAYFSTFLLLHYFGYSLNFLTNFSLILSFGIAIDTIIVIVQAAGANLRVGYNKQTALMLALKEYAVPIIAGVSVTIVVFIPLMTLPGIMGKFLAYIPITIFGVLAFGLLFTLTINSALYLLFVKNRKTYIHNPETLEYANKDQIELLELERVGKTEVFSKKIPIRTRVIVFLINKYKKILIFFLKHTFIRRISIILPIIFFVISIMVIVPYLHFELMPSDDNNLVSFSITGPIGSDIKVMQNILPQFPAFLSEIPEIKYSSFTISPANIHIDLYLFPKDERIAEGQKSVFEIESILTKKFKTLESQGFKVISNIASMSPPSASSSVFAIKFQTNDATNLQKLIRVSEDFETFLHTVPGTKNIKNSFIRTPGQFIFTLKKDLLTEYGIPTSIITQQIQTSTNGILVGTIEENGEDQDIRIKNTKFSDDINADMILQEVFTFKGTTYRIGDFIDIVTDNATMQIARKNGKIEIQVSTDIEDGYNIKEINTMSQEYLKSYDFPENIKPSAGGESAENMELIQAIILAFFLSVIVIFGILTLQFNSFSQPFIIFYSVIMSTPAVLIGLILTENSISIISGIGFIAFTGIAVNHGIILIDAIHKNIEKGMDGFMALVEAGSSRLEPMTLTTLATAFGILPIALRDKFWAGMGFTIIFGIITASFLTLFVLKGIYYEIYMRRERKKKQINE